MVTAAADNNGTKNFQYDADGVLEMGGRAGRQLDYQYDARGASRRGPNPAEPGRL